MPKVLIVDDEKIFRKGLKAMIGAWDPDWEVVGDAADGYEALDQVEALQPDMILTDIRMPHLDGISLQRIAQERFPSVACVVISGYEDFTYARQSMRYGAKDYLMKPVERNELGRILDKQKEDMTKRAKIPLKSFDGQDNEIRRYVSESIISGLIRGTIHHHHLDLLRKIGVHFELPCYCCLLIKLDKASVDSDRYFKADPSLFQLYIREFVQEMLNKRMKGYTLILSESEVIAIVNLNSEEGDRLNELSESIRRQIKSLSNLTVTIGVGRVVEGIEHVSSSYHDAEISLLYRLIVGGDKVLNYEDIRGNNDLNLEIDTALWEEMERLVLEGKPTEASNRAELFISELCQHAANPEVIYQKVCKLLLHFYEVSEELKLTKDWLGQRDIRSLIFEVCSISSSDELIKEFRNLLSELAMTIANLDPVRERDPIEQSLRYIHLHYSEPLSLTEIAGQVHLNAAYFSTLFKQRTGKTFIEQLTELRVEEAKKRLIRTKDKIAMIANETGFPNLRHFYRVFRRVTGLSPNDYRSIFQQERAE